MKKKPVKVLLKEVKKEKKWELADDIIVLTGEELLKEILKRPNLYKEVR